MEFLVFLLCLAAFSLAWLATVLDDDEPHGLDANGFPEDLAESHKLTK